MFKGQATDVGLPRVKTLVFSLIFFLSTKQQIWHRTGEREREFLNECDFSDYIGSSCNASTHVAQKISVKIELWTN